MTWLSSSRLNSRASKWFSLNNSMPRSCKWRNSGTWLKSALFSITSRDGKKSLITIFMEKFISLEAVVSDSDSIVGWVVSDSDSIVGWVVSDSDSIVGWSSHKVFNFLMALRIFITASATKTWRCWASPELMDCLASCANVWTHQVAQTPADRLLGA